MRNVYYTCTSHDTLLVSNIHTWTDIHPVNVNRKPAMAKWWCVNYFKLIKINQIVQYNHSDFWCLRNV